MLETQYRARQRMEQSQQYQKQQYDKTRSDRVFQPGDFVLLRVEPRHTKFGNRFEGPYEVLHRLGRVNYRIRLLPNGNRTRVVHANKLRFFYN